MHMDLFISLSCLELKQLLSCLFPGATSAPCLIFIFPAVFYIRIVPRDKEPMSSMPKILVRVFLPACCVREMSLFTLSPQPWALHVVPGRLFRRAGHFFHGDEPQLHHHRLDFRGWACSKGPLEGAPAAGLAPTVTAPLSPPD